MELRDLLSAHEGFLESARGPVSGGPRAGGGTVVLRVGPGGDVPDLRALGDALAEVGSAAVVLLPDPVGFADAPALAAALGGRDVLAFVDVEPEPGWLALSALVAGPAPDRGSGAGERSRPAPVAPDRLVARLTAWGAPPAPPPDAGERDRARAAALERVTEAQRARLVEYEHRSATLTERLAATEDALRRMRASVTMEVGRAVTAATSSPREAVRLPGRLWRARKQHAQRMAAVTRPPHTGGDARAGAPAAAGTARPAPGGRGFDLRLPRPTAPTAPRAPESLRYDVPAHLFVPRRLAEGGLAQYEPEALACFLAVLETAGPGAFWDVGANTGLYAQLAAVFTDREVVAFEPTPMLAHWCRELAVANDLAMRVEQVAAGASETTATFYLSDSTDSSNSLAQGFRASSAQLDVLVRPLDRFVELGGPVPAVLKIDTETTEPDVVQGALATLTEHRPWVLCEVLAGFVEERLTQMLAPLGYRWYFLGEDERPEPREAIAGDSTFAYLMWLFAPVEPPESFWESVVAWRRALAATAES